MLLAQPGEVIEYAADKWLLSADFVEKLGVAPVVGG
jgi:hypothetical protein